MLQMHLMRTFCFAKMHFCINKMLQMHLMPKCILAYIFQRKMFSCAKMHLMRTFCWCKNAFLQNKMLQMHFCNASHFPKENVQLCKNAFDAKMHLMPKCILATRTFSFGKCSASHFTKSNVQHQQNVTNAFDAVQKCI